MTGLRGRSSSPSGFNRSAGLSLFLRRRPARPLLITCDQACYLVHQTAGRPHRHAVRTSLLKHAAITRTQSGDRCTFGPQRALGRL